MDLKLSFKTCSIAGFTAALFFANMAAAEVIPASDARLEYSDFSRKTVEDDKVSFRRAVPHNRKYDLDNPGARLRFRCNATVLTVGLAYGERNAPARAQNSTGVWLIDGKGNDSWSFTRKGREPGQVTVTLPADGKMHDYELILPYGDIVGVNTVAVNDGASFEKPAPRPKTKVICFGDSVTHGFTSNRIDRTWPFLVGEQNGYEVVNLGLGGIGVNPADGDILGGEKMDFLVIALGVNCWQGGQSITSVKNSYIDLVGRFRDRQPETPIVLVTPLWVADSWKPEAAKRDLTEYRKAIKEVADAGFKRVFVIDGETLIDHDPALFDHVAVHPNDRGFAQMATRIAAALRKFGL